MSRLLLQAEGTSTRGARVPNVALSWIKGQVLVRASCSSDSRQINLSQFLIDL